MNDYLALSDVVVAADKWTAKDERISFRVWRGFLFRKTMIGDAGDGYSISQVLLKPQYESVIREWLN